MDCFQDVKEKYSYSEYAILAELKIADCYLYWEKYEEAIASYRDFRKLHPTNEHIPYVIFQSGLCYFNQISSIDRDQTMTYKAIGEFEYLVANYPSCEYVQQSREKIVACRKKLAQHAFYVGKFYFKSKNYYAALKRFEEVLNNYPDLGLDEQAYRYSQECRSFLQKKE
jgi:outer membrane protein assembly factor BamD